MPQSSLAKGSFKRVLGLQNWYPGLCNSKESAFIARFDKLQPFVDIHHSALSMMLIRQYAFDDMVNYNISDTDDIVELLNQFYYAWIICPTINLYNDKTVVTKRLSVYTVTVQRLTFPN